MGCAGASSYIDQFRKCVGRELFYRENRSYFEVLDDATKQYTNYLMLRCRDANISPKNEYFPEAIFVGYDPRVNRTHLYLLEPPHPPYEVPEPYRVAIGSGGLFANLLLITAETMMDRAQLVWTDLSTRLVAQFCYLVLARTISYDMHSGMNWSMCRIDEKGRAYLSDEELFLRKQGGEKYRLTVFVKTLLNEIPKEKLIAVAETYEFKNILSQYLGTL
jgi:hypothetical protein